MLQDSRELKSLASIRLAQPSRLMGSPFAVSSRSGVAVPGRAAMPIETQRRGVVAQHAAALLEDRLSEVLHRLARVHVHASGEDGGDVQARGVALQHAVGDEHEPVAHLQRQRLHPVAPSGQQPERRVSLQTNLLDLPGSKP